MYTVHLVDVVIDEVLLLQLGGGERTDLGLELLHGVQGPGSGSACYSS